MADTTVAKLDRIGPRGSARHHSAVAFAQDFGPIGAGNRAANLSFPKITPPRIGAMRQNHRMILQCLPSSICLGSLSSTCSGRADGLKSRISSCDISSILP
jgi:hypothetical protein